MEGRDSVATPALLFFPELIRSNIAEAIRMAGSAGRLRTHVKTHKTLEVTRLQLEAGITKFKCATIAEAEMVALAGGTDAILAYPPVGPNVGRFVALVKAYPRVTFGALFDDESATRALSAALTEAGLSANVYMDIDCGYHRTGIAPGPEAKRLYLLAAELPGLNPMGFHVYDGHHRQTDLAERTAAVEESLRPVMELRADIEAAGATVGTLICGGTPTFPVYAAMDFPGLELSPGTFTLHDVGYGSKFPDMAGFRPAAVVLTRVISKPTPTRVTLDVGTKAIASDPPAGKRCTVFEIPGEMVTQNEEHLVIEGEAAAKYSVGDTVMAFPSHVCPTSALYKSALTVEGGRVTGEWQIIGRDRKLTV